MGQKRGSPGKIPPGSLGAKKNKVSGFVVKKTGPVGKSDSRTPPEGAKGIEEGKRIKRD